MKTTIQKTSKIWELVQFLGYIAALLIGPLLFFLADANSPGLRSAGLLTIGGGILVVVIGRFLAWWNNG